MKLKFIRYNICFLCVVILTYCGKKTDIPDDNTIPEIDSLPSWSEGYLDIHAINTGNGECTFFIFPDGTTMLVDAGAALTPPPESLPKPNDSKSPGQWISRYIMHMLKEFPVKKLDYMVLTHFHWDHMGGISAEMPISASGAYQLSGITEVGDNIRFDKVIDRDWPDYKWPLPIDDDKMKNYIKFLNWHVKNRNVVVEQFEAGQNIQLILKKNPAAYTNFEIRNIAVNGYVWTGIESNVQNHFPELEELEVADYPPENACSIAFRISYGDFDYFGGGDISFRGTESGHAEDQWKDIEAPIALVTGHVDVFKANHHGNWDANSEKFLSALQPRVIVIHTWLNNQPAYNTWIRMTSTKTYPDPPDIFVTNILEAKAIELGPEIYKMKSTQGHIVIRVEPGGVKYSIYVLDDSFESYQVKAIHGPYNSR